MEHEQREAGVRGFGSSPVVEREGGGRAAAFWRTGGTKVPRKVMGARLHKLFEDAERIRTNVATETAETNEMIPAARAAVGGPFVIARP